MYKSMHNQCHILNKVILYQIFNISQQSIYYLLARKFYKYKQDLISFQIFILNLLNGDFLYIITT